MYQLYPSGIGLIWWHLHLSGMFHQEGCLFVMGHLLFRGKCFGGKATEKHNLVSLQQCVLWKFWPGQNQIHIKKKKMEKKPTWHCSWLAFSYATFYKAWQNCHHTMMVGHSRNYCIAQLLFSCVENLNHNDTKKMAIRVCQAHRYSKTKRRLREIHKSTVDVINTNLWKSVYVYTSSWKKKFMENSPNIFYEFYGRQHSWHNKIIPT